MVLNAKRVDALALIGAQYAVVSVTPVTRKIVVNALMLFIDFIIAPRFLDRLREGNASSSMDACPRAVIMLGVRC